MTTGDFTGPAEDYAGRCGIVCVGRDALLAWSEGREPAPWTAPADGPEG